VVLVLVEVIGRLEDDDTKVPKADESGTAAVVALLLVVAVVMG
jgi:hypothetical protein